MDELMHLAAIRNVEEAEQFRPNRQRHPLLELSNVQFVKMFRLSKDLFRYVIDRLDPALRPQRRHSDLSTQTKVLAALNFFANGSYQTNVGASKHIDVSQASVSVCLKEVVNALIQPDIYNEWVHFPENFQALNAVRQGFFEKHGFPGVVGCIDCTHVAIVPPKNDENYAGHLYVKRKGYHSINVQLICDADLKILNVNARFADSTNDSFIWNQSLVQYVLRDIHATGERDYFLLGDSGYPLRTWLLTPFPEVVDGTPEAHYNVVHKHTRAKIECCNGVLKERFRCLLKHRVLHYDPEMACKIITACAVLHNMCINFNVPDPDNDEKFDMGLTDAPVHENEAGPGPGRINPELASGRQARIRLVRLLNAHRAH